jgi:hypothetical protein
MANLESGTLLMSLNGRLLLKDVTARGLYLLEALEEYSSFNVVMGLTVVVDGVVVDDDVVIVVIVMVDGDGVVVVVVPGSRVVVSSSSLGTKGVVMASSADVRSLALSNKLAKVTPLDN